MNKKGWVLSNNENGDVVIQKDDEVDRFKSDDEATKFVVESYGKLLKAVERFLESSVCTNKCNPNDMSCNIMFARSVVKEAKSK